MYFYFYLLFSTILFLVTSLFTCPLFLESKYYAVVLKRYLFGDHTTNCIRDFPEIVGYVVTVECLVKALFATVGQSALD